MADDYVGRNWKRELERAAAEPVHELPMADPTTTDSAGRPGSDSPGRPLCPPAQALALPRRDVALDAYAASMDVAGGIYTSDFRAGFRHALLMVAVYEKAAHEGY